MNIVHKTENTFILADLEQHCASALASVDKTVDTALADMTKAAKNEAGKIDPEWLEKNQFNVHGLAWLATYKHALSQLFNWYRNLELENRTQDTDKLLLQIGFGEYLAQIIGGIPMSQNEIFRPRTAGVDLSPITENQSVNTLIDSGNTDTARRQLANHFHNYTGHSAIGDTGLDEETAMIREQFYRFSQDNIAPHAHNWHLDDTLIPREIIDKLAEMGVFGLTIPEQYGGFELGKLAMCVVSEELSRGYIGIGSLGTRSEIAAELIMHGGTEHQKETYLPAIASGEILPTAAFTEPNTGSDLGAIRTRATKSGDNYTINGGKTWITHAARADLMTLLVRTDPTSTDYRGVSMLLAEKSRATEDNDFPDKAISGTEIEVLGYRGMKEYELSFDGYQVPAAQLLGTEEGQGFKQLMQTFESARIQTGARAIGVAQNAFELGLKYAQERTQFGKPILEFPRVYGKLAMMAVEIMIARQLTYHAAREKDSGRRCDLEAGMAKLLAARVAWSSADNALQIHGGNGFALEYPISRVLCDSRVLNIFEGAAEIQAQVIARRLLS